MTEIRAVIFDIGGVLQANPPTGWQARWAQQVGIDEAELTERLEATAVQGGLGTITLAQAEAQMTTALGLTSDDDLRSMMSDIWQEYLGTLNHQLADYFRRLRPRYRTGILSNSFVGAREREDEAYHFEEMCDVVVYSHEEGLMKPDPRIYGVACSRLGVQAAEAVFLDDREVCVDGARAAGLQAVAFGTNEQAIAEIERLLANGGGRPT